tara:strand:+ start:1672 stop:1833 length:162 start_codon:yes stop_codon:yes gene_type:complete
MKYVVKNLASGEQDKKRTALVIDGVLINDKANNRKGHLILFGNSYQRLFALSS